MDIPRGNARARSAGLAGILLVAPFLGGCLMHSFGQGTRADMHGRPGTDRQTKLLEKEVQRDDFTATLEVPPLRAGKESELTVKVRDSRDGTPIRKARVSIGIISLEGGASIRPGPGGNSITLAAQEDSVPGVYVARHRFEEPGPVEIVAEILTSDEWTRRPPLVVAARQDVFSGVDTMSRRMRTPLFVLGAVGMLVMMGAFML